jgi:hypothetical protein
VLVAVAKAETEKDVGGSSGSVATVANRMELTRVRVGEITKTELESSSYSSASAFTALPPVWDWPAAVCVASWTCGRWEGSPRPALLRGSRANLSQKFQRASG